MWRPTNWRNVNVGLKIYAEGGDVGEFWGEAHKKDASFQNVLFGCYSVISLIKIKLFCLEFLLDIE